MKRLQAGVTDDLASHDNVEYGIMGSWNDWKTVHYTNEEANLLLPPGRHYFWLVDGSALRIS